MHFVIHCIDKPQSSAMRRDQFEAHKAHVAASAIKVLVSGPLVAEDFATPVGSFFLVETSTLAEVERFNRNDPFFKAGLWERIAIHPFLKRVDNR